MSFNLINMRIMHALITNVCYTNTIILFAVQCKHSLKKLIKNYSGVWLCLGLPLPLLLALFGLGGWQVAFLYSHFLSFSFLP
jgi:hypothetical protein